MSSIKDMCDLLIKKKNYKCESHHNNCNNNCNNNCDNNCNNNCDNNSDCDSDDIIATTNINSNINMNLEFTIPPKSEVKIKLPIYDDCNNKIIYTIKITAENNLYETMIIHIDEHFTLCNNKVDKECKYTVEITEAIDIYHFGYNDKILFEDPNFSIFFKTFIHNKSKFKLYSDCSYPCIDFKHEENEIFKTWEGAEYLTRVKDWGNNLYIKDFSCAFYFCTSLISVPTNLPTSVRKMNWMFAFATNFETDLSNWDVSKILYMDGMFCSANKFDYSTIKDWNINNVKKMNDLRYFTDGYSRQNLYYHK